MLEIFFGVSMTVLVEAVTQKVQPDMCFSEHNFDSESESALATGLILLPSPLSLADSNFFPVSSFPLQPPSCLRIGEFVKSTAKNQTTTTSSWIIISGRHQSGFAFAVAVVLSIRNDVTARKRETWNTRLAHV